MPRGRAAIMVLENASDISSNGYSDDAPVSDSDPYSSSGTPKKNILIDTSNFPQPMPILGGWFGYNTKFLSKLVGARIQYATKILQRPPSEDEVNAMAYWTAKNMSIASYGGPLGVAAGSWRAYSSAGTFRFPFYSPNLEQFNSLVYPIQRAAIFTGARAVLAWHATRFVAYAVMGSFFGRMFSTSYALSVSSVGEYTDPRLKEYIQALRKSSPIVQNRLPNQPKQTRTAEAAQHEDGSPQWRDIKDPEPDEGRSDGSTISGTAPPNAKIRPQETRRMPSRAPMQEAVESYQMRKRIQDSDDGFDDASPTGGRGMEDTGAGAGSAWDRVRQGSSSQPAGTRGSSWPTQQGQQPTRPAQSAWQRGGDVSRHREHASQRKSEDEASSEDSFSFSKTDEERQLAREEAQREFDARVERERSGGDFSSDSSGQKRW